jgi:hypothetical protein
MENVFTLEGFDPSSESGESEGEQDSKKSIYELRTVKPSRVRSMLESLKDSPSYTTQQLRELRTLINKAHAPIVAITANCTMFKEILQKIRKTEWQKIKNERGFSGTLLDLYQEIEYKAKVSAKFVEIFEEFKLTEEIQKLEVEVEEVRREGIERRRREKNKKARQKKHIKAKLEKQNLAEKVQDALPASSALPLTVSPEAIEIPAQWEIQDPFQESQSSTSSSCTARNPFYQDELW